MSRVKKIIDYNLILFPFLWLFTLFLGLVEVFTYSGSIAKHFFLGFRFYLALSIFGGCLTKFTHLKRGKMKYKVIFLLNKPAFLLFSFLMVLFSFLETGNFPNYVFSTYHLQPRNLFWPWLLSGFLILIELLPSSRRVSSKEAIKRAIFWGMFGWVLMTNFFDISSGILKSLYYIGFHPFVSYDDRMRKAVGQEFYDFTLFIKENTPEDAKILIPPQGFPWFQTGHSAYLRYFIYSRDTIHGKEYELGVDLQEERIDYVLLAWGESSSTQYGYTHGWPKFDLKAKQVIYMVDGLNKKIVPGDYQYDPDQKNLWGLIELDNQ